MSSGWKKSFKYEIKVDIEGREVSSSQSYTHSAVLKKNNNNPEIPPALSNVPFSEKLSTLFVWLLCMFFWCMIYVHWDAPSCIDHVCRGDQERLLWPQSEWKLFENKFPSVDVGVSSPFINIYKQQNRKMRKATKRTNSGTRVCNPCSRLSRKIDEGTRKKNASHCELELLLHLSQSSSYKLPPPQNRNIVTGET